MKKYYFFMFIAACVFLNLTAVQAQQIYVQSVDQSIDKYTLEVVGLEELPRYPESQMQPSYGYFWIFEDDGTFSFNEYPDHQFGFLKHVTMEATPRYTPINRSPRLICQSPVYPPGITVASNPQNPTFPFSSYNSSVQIQSSRDPFYDHERTLILSYDNPSQACIHGAKIILYFNSSETSLYDSNEDFNGFNPIIGQSGQAQKGIKAFNAEIIPGTSVVNPSSHIDFDSEIVIDIPEIPANSSHNLFFRFKTDLISGNVDFEVSYTASNDLVQINETKNLNQAVVSAYDPNKVTVDKDFVHYDGIIYQGAKLTYTVYFQNEGEGPTEGLNILCPNNYNLDMKSLSHLSSKYDTVLKLPLKWTEDRVIWCYNLSLPGTNQAGFECDQEATRGWMKFTVDTYTEDFYNTNYGLKFTLKNTAFIDFPNISLIETMPVSTLLAGESEKSHFYNGTAEQEKDNNNSLKIQQAYKTDNSHLKVFVTNNRTEKLQVLLINSTGQTVFRDVLRCWEESASEINIPVRSLSRGLYIISVQNGTSTVKRKIIL